MITYSHYNLTDEYSNIYTIWQVYTVLYAFGKKYGLTKSLITWENTWGSQKIFYINVGFYDSVHSFCRVIIFQSFIRPVLKLNNNTHIFLAYVFPNTEQKSRIQDRYSITELMKLIYWLTNFATKMPRKNHIVFLTETNYYCSQNQSSRKLSRTPLWRDTVPN